MGVLKNSKHEIVARCLFEGLSQADALNKAGYRYISDRRNGGGVASRLAHNSTVLARVRELHEEAARLAVAATQERTTRMMSKDRRLERLSDIAEEDIEGKYGPLRHPNISAIRELNLMTGDYAPEKHAILGNFVIEVEYVNRDRRKAQNKGDTPDTT